MEITFRCLPWFESWLPRPIPAVHGLPDWFRSMPQAVFSTLQNNELDTVKRCPPFVDAMTCGFLMPLAVDISVENGKLSWESTDLRSKKPVDLHENVQVYGTPLFDRERNVMKFNNYWTIETPPGYSVLITHPVNRFDLPFTTVTGLVDSDLYSDSFVNFPVQWHDHNYSGVLPQGMPIAQCIPVKRETWEANFELFDQKAGERLLKISEAIAAGPGVYRKQFRARH